MELEKQSESSKVDVNLMQIQAIGQVYESVKNLPPSLALSVLNYVGQIIDKDVPRNHDLPPSSEIDSTVITKARGLELSHAVNGDIHPIASKWMVRNSFNESQLSIIFSLGLDEVDVVVQRIPGKSKRERMKNIFILKGIAAFLKNGSSKFSHDQVREACQHYDAWDKDNFTNYFKTFSSEIGGTKATGYTLSSRGMTSAVETIRLLIN